MLKKSNGFPHFTATSCCGSESSRLDPDSMGSLDPDMDLDLGGAKMTHKIEKS
jgi:hypothetical protein